MFRFRISPRGLARQAAVGLSRRGLVDLAAARQAWGGRLVLSEEVEHALSTGQPVVALESTIITHGMPHPVNLTTALTLESILRSHRSVPATIALLDGRVHVGVSRAELERLADPENPEPKTKVSRRDIAPVLARRGVGGTTVAGTMYVARSVGIGVFVTGGIGGVHRGAESSMDISADLIELGRTPMAVVCAGAKSILDIPRTLEVLETQGVCVATYGDKPDFPAFYTPSSGMQSPWTVRDPHEAARLIHTSLTLPRPLSTLLAVPIPSEHSTAGAKVQEAVEQAVRESVEQGIDKRGKEVTPWLLKRVGELTTGSALELNVKLIENNAHVGGRVAAELAKMQEQDDKSHASSSLYVSTPPASSPSAQLRSTTTSATVIAPPAAAALPAPSVLVFGSAAIDITSTTSVPLSPRSTTPGSIYLSPGGVGRNIAEAAQSLLPTHAVQLVSLIGVSGEDGTPDGFGKVLLADMESVGMRTDGLVQSQRASTAACTLTLEPDGDLVAGVADMGIVETMGSDVVVDSIGTHQPEMVVFDCNPTEQIIAALLRTCLDRRIPTFCDPTSVPKLPRLTSALFPLLPSSPSDPRPLTHLSPNTLELDLIHQTLTSASPALEELSWEYISSLNLTSEWRTKVEALSHRPGLGLEWITREGIVQKAVGCLPWITSLWVKAGMRGLLHLRITTVKPEPQPVGSGISQKLEGVHEGKFLALTHYPAVEVPEGEVVSTTGAGDTLVGGLVAGLLSREEETVLVQRAMERVTRTLRSRRAVG